MAEEEHTAATAPQTPSPASKLWQSGAVGLLSALGGVGIPAACWATSTLWPLAAAPLVSGAAWFLHHSALRATTAHFTQTEEHLRALTVQDELTGCHNRTGLYLLGDQLLQSVRRRGDAVHAFVADISHLTAQGEPLRADLADQVMVAVADALRSSVRGTDVVSRWEDRQFVIVGPGTGVHPGELERRVRSHLADAPHIPLDTWPCRITVGQASLAPWDGGDLTTLIEKAQKDFTMRRSMRSPSTPDAFFARAPIPPNAQGQRPTGTGSP